MSRCSSITIIPAVILLLLVSVMKTGAVPGAQYSVCHPTQDATSSEEDVRTLAKELCRSKPDCSTDSSLKKQNLECYMRCDDLALAMNSNKFSCDLFGMDCVEGLDCVQLPSFPGGPDGPSP